MSSYRALRLTALFAVVVVGMIAPTAPMLSASPSGKQASLLAAEPGMGAAGASLASVEDAASVDVLVRADQPSMQTLLHATEAQIGVEAKDLWPGLGAFRITVTGAQLRLLQKLAPVLHVERDETVHADLDTATSWFGVQKARADFGVTGDRDGSQTTFSTADVGICVVDTGVDATHQDLVGKVLAWKDFVNGRTAPYDDHGHGTHVSSIAAGTGAADFRYRGVAPGAFIAAAKVLDSSGSGPASRIIQGVQWCTQQTGVRVISMSLGGSGCSDGTDTMSMAVNAAHDKGFAVVVAAGNSGPGPCTVASPGAATGAITIGALADPGEGGIFLAPFSSRGPTLDGRQKPDVVAPGVNIVAAAANTVNGYRAMSGTSMATPFVAGTAALMLAANPSLTPEQVRSILRTTAGDWGRAGVDNEWGAGRLKAYESVKAAGSFITGSNPSVGKHDGWGENVAAGAWHFGKVNVTGSGQPLALTLLLDAQPTCGSVCTPDLDLYAYAPGTDLSGTPNQRHARATAVSDGVSREEQASVAAPAVGVWTIEVFGYAGTGTAVLDAGHA